MEFKPEITIKGNTFKYVDTQRGGITAIYKNDSSYLRIGDHDQINKILTVHKKMESYGFPVPTTSDEGRMEGMSYFIEESLGLECFGNIFKKETEEFGQIQNKTFDEFVDVCVRFAEAQLKTATPTKNWEIFRKGIYVDVLCSELPDKAKKILDVYKNIEKRLSVFPFALTHGDFGPFNIYPKGIIDIEDSFMGPAGYDLGSVIEHLNWFPDSMDYEYIDYEYYKLYNFTPEQKKKLSDRIDIIYMNHQLPKVSDYLADFNFTRGIWFAVRLNHTPKLQKFRYELIGKLSK